MCTESASNLEYSFSTKPIEGYPPLKRPLAAIKRRRGKETTVDFVVELLCAFRYVESLVPVVAHRVGFPPTLALRLQSVPRSRLSSICQVHPWAQWGHPSTGRDPCQPVYIPAMRSMPRHPPRPGHPARYPV